MFRFRSKKAQNQLFVPEVLSNNPSPRRKKFRWPVFVVELRKWKKHRKVLKTIANVNLTTIQYINILRTISLSQETTQYPCFKPEKDSLAHRDPYTWNMQKIFQKVEKIFKFYPNITKTGVIILIDIPLISVTMHQLIIKPWRRSQGPWCRQKFKKIIKMQFLKNCLNSW